MFSKKKPKRIREKDRQYLLNCITYSKEVFQDAVKTAEFSLREGLPNNIKEHAEYATNSFNNLSNEAKNAVWDDDYDRIKKRASELENQIAYVIPPTELIVEARCIYQELVEWNVPDTVLKNICETISLIERNDSSEADKRACLYNMYEAYDYWCEYIEWVEDRNNIIRYTSSSGVIAGLIISVLLLFVKKNIVIGFLFAGMSGASLSVLLKIPNIMEYGDYTAAIFSSFARIGAGIVANIIGLGLLSSGMVNIAIANGEGSSTISALISEFNTNPNTVLSGSILISIGIVLGFAERALPLLERIIMGKISEDKNNDKEGINEK